MWEGIWAVKIGGACLWALCSACTACVPEKSCEIILGDKSGSWIKAWKWGSPTQLSQHSQQRVFYNEPSLLAFWCYAGVVGFAFLLRAQPGEAHSHTSLDGPSPRSVVQAVSQEFCAHSPWEWVLQGGSLHWYLLPTTSVVPVPKPWDPILRRVV